MESSRANRSAFWAAVLGAALALAGCSGPTQSGSADEGSDGAEGGTGVEDAVSALQAAAALSLDVEYAMQRIEQLCMESQGFDVHPMEPTPPNADQVEQYLSDNLITDTPWFLEIPESFAGQEVVDPSEDDGGEDAPTEDDPPEMPAEYWDEYDEALIGEVDFTAGEDDPDAWPVTGGCKGETQDRLFTDGGLGRTDVIAPRGLSEEAVESALRDDQAWTTVSLDWGACVQDGGFPAFDDPGQAVGYINYAKNPDDPGASSIEGPKPEDAPWSEAQVQQVGEELASVLRECDEQTGFTDVSQERWNHHKLQIMTDLETELWAWQENLELASERAGDIIENGWQ